MDDEENQDKLINRNTSQGKSRRQGPFATDDDDDVEESEESGSEDEEDDLDEEDGSEGSGEEDDEDEQELPLEGSEAVVSTADLNDGSSSDEERENCPICLNGFRDQVVGTPENCNHYFCLDCIVEWAKNANSCPVDRITFSCIHIRTHYGGDIIKKVPVENKADEIVEIDDDPTNCEVCGRSDREDRLLLCDGCDAGYHMECLTPALHAIPVDEWFCPECAATNQSDEEHVSEEEVSNLLADVVPTTTRLRTNAVRTRAIARTRQSERVRANVSRIRTTARNTQNVPRYLLSLLDETIEAVVAGLNSAVYTRNLTTRPAPTRRKRTTGKKAPSKVPKGGRRVGKRRRRRVKRRSRKQTSKKAPTSHKRIAKSLGLCCPARGSAIPRIQRAPEQTLGSMRSDIGAATLSVFGNPFDLDPFDSIEGNGSGPSSPLTAKRRVLSRSALRSHQPVARPISVGLSRGGVAPSAHGSVAVAEPVPDLLGSILSGQSMLMMKSSDITISRDGSLMAKKSNNALLQRKSSGEVEISADVMETSPSHSGSPTATSIVNTWKPVEQPTQPIFPSSSLYSMTPSPPPSRGLDRLTGPSSSMSGGLSFRLKNTFTPRVVQVQSSASRLVSKPVEGSRFNGTFHRPEPSNLSNHTPPKTPEVKHPTKPPALRLDISEFPRIPKIKKEIDNSPNSEAGRRLEPSYSNNSNANSSGPAVNQLTGRGENNQLGRLTTAENAERNSQQESQAHLRSTGGASSSHSTSSSSKAPPCSNSSRNIGSSDSGGGGLRITISGGSTNSCRQFSPVDKDPFRTSDSKLQQKFPPHYTATKKEKTVKNEIYDPFEPTGSDSGSPSSSPERPVTPPKPPTSAETSTSTPQSSGVKVGAFRSFKFTSHSSKVGASKLGPDFSGMSPTTNKEPEEPKSQVKVSPSLPSFLKLEKEIKKEVFEDINDHPPFRVSCPLGLKITSDLKAGGIRGFHFDSDDHPIVSTKPDPDVHLDKTCLQSTSRNRLLWDEESLPEPTSVSRIGTNELQKKKNTEDLKAVSCSTSRRHSRERESRSPLSIEDKERDKKYKLKSHKTKRARSDRSSSGSGERKKKRQKERKKEKKRKRSESRERRRSRSSSHSSSSRRVYNSKKKKKKKRDSRSESPRRSVSPDKERKRKHKTDKSKDANKDGSTRVKEKKKSKEDRGKQKSKSPEMVKEYKAHKSKDRPLYKDTEITRHIVLSPNNNEKTITCTVSFKTESPTIVQETKKPLISLTKDEDEDEDEDDEVDAFLYSERKVSIKESSSSELSDQDYNDDEDYKAETNSPPWSPSLLETLLPETKSEDVPEPPSPQDTSPVNYLPPDLGDVSPQDFPMSMNSDPPSPEPHSPQVSSHTEVAESTPDLAIKKEADDLQWSPSHLDDLLLNDLSDDVYSVDAASPVDVDLEEAILMKRECDYKEPTVINFSKTAPIPFLQDDNSLEAEAGNHIDERDLNTGEPEPVKSDEPIEEKEEESGSLSISKSKSQIKRVTWNLHDKESEKSTPEQSLSSPFYSSQNEEPWLLSLEHPDVEASSYVPEPSSETSSPITWIAPDTPVPVPVVQSISQPVWNSGTSLLTPTENKPEDKPIAHIEDRLSTLIPGRPVKEVSQVPWVAAEKPLQVPKLARVFPQTLPPLPLPPVFPPYAPVIEPTVTCMVESNNRTLHGQTPKAQSLATANEPKIQAASAGEEKGKSKPKKVEKVKNEEYMKKLHIQERAVEEVKLAIKPFYQKREITKDEYKEILRKAVQKICHSKSGEINPVKVVNLVKGYVDKYKHIRNKNKKPGAADDPDLGQESPV